MNIIVCVKQVPGTTKVAVDENTGVLLRSGVEAKLNPYDLYALETAVQIKQTYGATITVITMGPPQAAEAVREAFALGADNGIMLTDMAFAGADTLATAYALAGGIGTRCKYDLIVCGKQTTDGDTAQVGPSLAEFLDIPHMSNVISIDKAGSENIHVSADIGEYVGAYEIKLPCAITVDKGIYVPRLPSYKRMLESVKQEITVLGLEDLADTNPKMYGLSGSPTQVEKIYQPEAEAGQVIIDGSPNDIASRLCHELRELKYL
ncbi:MAG: electron transfer flavoprotein subunit beta/FixA family protein [Defluviitaleaceae bacterium]|nr:electron transfer flavoprotein subunit beta/FixA family protein [Defluviitaleaceae bacterium]